MLRMLRSVTFFESKNVTLFGREKLRNIRKNCAQNDIKHIHVLIVTEKIIYYGYTACRGEGVFCAAMCFARCVCTDTLLHAKIRNNRNMRQKTQTGQGKTVLRFCGMMRNIWQKNVTSAGKNRNTAQESGPI